MEVSEFIDMNWRLGERIKELLEYGLVGRDIARVLRDEGFPMEGVRIALTETGFFVETQMFLELKGLHVSDYPLLPGEEIPIYNGNRASATLAIWLRAPGPSSRNAHLN
jgi:hypothetical protein